MLEAEYVLYISYVNNLFHVIRELKKESYGVELLNAIGFVYAAKSRHYLASNQTFLGVGGWLHNVQGKYHVFSETSVSASSQIASVS